MIDPIERRKWVDSLINIDILELKPKTTAMIDYIISKSNARVQTLSLSLVSMISSSQAGIDYLIETNVEYVRKYYDHIIHVPEFTVAHRSALAILYKFSSHKDFALALMDNKIDTFILDFMQRYSPKKSIHSFFPIYYMALSYNILTSPCTQAKIGKFSTCYATLCASLLDFFKKDLPSGAHQTILEIFRYLMGPKEVYYRDLLMESRAEDTLRVYYSSLQSMFAGRSHILDIHLEQFSNTIRAILDVKPKLTDKEELAARKAEKAAQEEREKNRDKPRKMHDFEGFKDEILEDSFLI